MSYASPSTSDSAPWNIYADQLLHHGYGYPLWMPDSDPSVSEAEIGDVGWLQHGGFYQLFNSMKAKGESQVRGEVPQGYEPFSPPTLAIAGPHDKILQPILCGRSIKQVDVDIGVSTNAPSSLGVSTGINFGFKCTSDRGAFLALSPPAVSKNIQSKKHIIDYMRENFDQWCEFANTKFGLGLKDDEILFISGTTKTDRWAVTAFRGERRRTEGTFAANLGSLGEVTVTVSTSNETLPSRYYRSGPPRPGSRAQAMLLPNLQPSMHAQFSSLSEEPNQTIFLNYYKMKRRRFWKGLSMKAAAAGASSPTDESDWEDDPHPESSPCIVDDSEVYISSEGYSKAEMNVDPVGHILDYILEHSSASYAVASYDDVFTLFKDEFPGLGDHSKDVMDMLRKLDPIIELDSNGVGAIQREMSSTRLDVMPMSAVVPDETLNNVRPSPAESMQSPQSDVPMGQGAILSQVPVRSDGHARSHSSTSGPPTAASRLRSFPIRLKKHAVALGRQEISVNCCETDTTDTSIDDILTGAKLILEATQKVGTSVVPIPGIGPVSTTLIALIDNIKETRSNHKGLEAVSREVSHLVNTIDTAMSKVKRNIEEIPSSDPRRYALVDGLKGSSKLESRVVRLFNDLGELRVKAETLYRGSWWLRWIYSSRDATTLEELRKGIVECRHYFKIECQIAIQASMEEVLKSVSSTETKVNSVSSTETKVNSVSSTETKVENVSSIKTKVEKMQQVLVKVAAGNTYSREEKILQRLPHVDASYRSVVNAGKNSLLSGTRAELFEAINDWADGRSQELSGKTVCILTGDTGTGKSTIASEFARQRNNRGDYGASFFFVRGVVDLDSTRLVFPTLAYQLAQSQDALRPHVVRAVREHLKRGKIQQMKFQAESLLHRPVHDVGSEHPSMILVIDALDECSEEILNLVPEMLDLLIESIRQAQFPLRIFFTSRPNSLIENRLQRSQWAPLVHMVSLNDISPESVQRDMAIFVRDKITKIPSGQALLQQQPDVVDRLARRAGGLFVYAKTAVDFLGDYPDFVEDGLDELLSKGSSSFATALQPLDDLYLTVLEIAFPSKDLSQAPQLHQALELTLGSLAVLHNPLSPSVLEALTGVPRKDICNVLSRLRAVVLFDEAQTDEKIRAMHATFPQFLVDSNRCKSTWYHVDVSRQHARLAVGCLRALQALEENMCRLLDPAVPQADVPDLEERLRAYVPEHVQYASAHWAAHLGDACELGKKHIGTACGCREIGERLTAFARTKLGAWVEVMAYMGRLDTVKEALCAARAYLKGVPQDQEVDSLLARAQQLVVDHYLEIEDCPYDVHRARAMPDNFSSAKLIGTKTVNRAEANGIFTSAFR